MFGQFGKEKLLVEFDVERTVVHPRYPYEEKYLMFGGRSIPYKAILRRGKLVAIVSRAYVLVPNEYVADVLRKSFVSIVNEFDDGRKYWAIVGVNGKRHYAIVRNSVDGSWSLRVDGVFVFKEARSVIKVRTEAVYRKHVGDVGKFVDELSNEIVRVIDKMFEVEKYILSAADMRFSKDDVEVLFEALPKKYLVGVRSAVFYGKSVLEVWRMITKRIWSSRSCSMDRKIMLMSKLNDWLFLKVGLEI